jgi:hypothetical protein
MRLTETKLRQIIREELREASIGSYLEDITIEVDVSKTRHASERQGRHRDRITDEEIIATAEEATDVILRRIIENSIDVGDEIVIRDMTYDLNLVCVLEPKRGSADNLELRVITVMRKKNFKPKRGSKVVDIY